MMIAITDTKEIDQEMKRLTNSVTLIIIILTVAMAMSGCNRKAVYSHYEPIAVSGWGWEKTDTIRFYLPQTTEMCHYTEELGLRTTQAYPYTNVVLVVVQKSVPSGFERKDTVEFELVSNDGQRLGQGFKYFHQIKSLPDVTIPKGDSLSINVCHNMRNDHLKGIAAVGITVKRKR
jgi:gliding motility-associated lipoprotein GldH